MPSNLPRDSPNIVDLCAIRSEPWFTSSFECPYVAAYCAGRLFHSLNWLLLRGALRGRLERRPIALARNRLWRLLASIIGEPDFSGLRLAALEDYDSFMEWFNSEGRDAWCEALRSMPGSNNKLVPARLLREPGIFLQNLILIESADAQETPIDLWSPGTWDELESVRTYIGPLWDSANEEAT